MYLKVLVPDLLLDKGALEHDEHHEGEDGVVPVLVQTPQSNTEHLQKIYEIIRDGPDIGITLYPDAARYEIQYKI